MLRAQRLAFVSTHVLRGQIAREFPDVEAVSIRASMHEYAHALNEKISRARAEVAPTASYGHSKADEIERFAALHDRGAISDEEYAAAKRELFRIDG